MISWEYLLFVSDMYILGGFEHMTPVQATAQAFGSSQLPDETRATGSGDMYIPGFISRLDMRGAPFLKMILKPL